jgi:thiol-disulfide isomerase/thioredoxin
MVEKMRNVPGNVFVPTAKWKEAQLVRATAKSLALDILVGLLAFAVLALAMARFKVIILDLRAFLSVSGFLFLLAGFTRGRGAFARSALRGLVVSFGGILPSLLLAVSGQAFDDRVVLIMFWSVAALGAIAGAESRQLWSDASFGKGLLAFVLPLAAIVIGSFLLLPLLMSRLSSESIDRPIPPFSISSLDGKLIKSSDFRGQVVVLAFWTTWCAPCREELSKLQALHSLYKSNSAVVFIAVDASRGGDTIDKARSFANENDVNLPCAFDSQGVSSILGVDGFPTIVVLGKSGRMRWIHTGYDGSEPIATDVGAVISTLLTETK